MSTENETKTDRDPVLEAALIAAGDSRLHGHRNEQMLAAIAAVTPFVRQQVAEEIATTLDARSNAYMQIAADETEPGQDNRIKHVSMASGFQSAAIIARKIGGAA
jgi:hypothetical protein